MGWIEVLTVVAIAAQGGLISVDEWHFHRKRRLGRWEAWSHPVDSILFALPLAIAFAAPPSQGWLAALVATGLLSALSITKDEWVHAAECEPAELWLHSLLFMLHPVVLLGTGFLWWTQAGPWIRAPLPFLAAGYAVYQVAYWTRGSFPRPAVNNAFYETLGRRWHDDDAHAVALLRVEGRKKLEYVLEVLRRECPGSPSILDIGCGAGFISNPLAERGFRVKGVDSSGESLRMAEAHAPPGSRAAYERQDAYALQEPDGRWDVVLMLDVLEHLDDPRRALREAARVLKPEGLLIFHTFNRTLPGWILGVHGMKFVARDCPEHVHVYELFLKPGELAALLAGEGRTVREFRGLRPVFWSRPFWWSLAHRRVHPDFAFTFTRSLAVGYLGYAGRPDPAGVAARRAGSGTEDRPGQRETAPSLAS